MGSLHLEADPWLGVCYYQALQLVVINPLGPWSARSMAFRGEDEEGDPQAAKTGSSPCEAPGNGVFSWDPRVGCYSDISLN